MVPRFVASSMHRSLSMDSRSIVCCHAHAAFTRIKMSNEKIKLAIAAGVGGNKRLVEHACTRRLTRPLVSILSFKVA